MRERSKPDPQLSSDPAVWEAAPPTEAATRHPPKGTGPRLEYRAYVRYSNAGVPHVATAVVPQFAPSVGPDGKPLGQAVNHEKRLRRALATALGLASPRARRRGKRVLDAAVRHWRARLEERQAAAAREAEQLAAEVRASGGEGA
jgi:hypothetical protein